ncbi:MAG: alpha/beta hydrolase [Nitriliruptoraceae bacterium]
MSDVIEPVAVVERAVQEHVDVAGVSVSYRRWRSDVAHTLVLLHGSGAHGLWFAGMVPHLTALGEVIAIDFSGHGDSAWRHTYHPTTWADEVEAVLAATNADTVSVVAHSMGGYVAAELLARDRVAADDATIFDTRFRAKDGAKSPPSGTPRVNLPTYETFAQARARFRYIPEQPDVNAELTDVVAREAVGIHGDRFGWKVDPKAFGTFHNYPFDLTLARITVPLTYAYGGRSEVCDASSAAFVSHHCDSPTTIAVLPDAYHHVVIDDPLGCARIVAAQRHQLLTDGT